MSTAMYETDHWSRGETYNEESGEWETARSTPPTTVWVAYGDGAVLGWGSLAAVRKLAARYRGEAYIDEVPFVLLQHDVPDSQPVFGGEAIEVALLGQSEHVHEWSAMREEIDCSMFSIVDTMRDAAALAYRLLVPDGTWQARASEVGA